MPAPSLGVGLVPVMTGVNLMSARSYGEFEFWFASIKVAAILMFIVLPAAAAFGLAVAHGRGVRPISPPWRLYAAWVWRAVLAGVTTVFFSLTGAEITTVAAAESRDPTAPLRA